MCNRIKYGRSKLILLYPGPKGFSWNFSSGKRERAAKKNFKKNLWHQGNLARIDKSKYSV